MSVPSDSASCCASRHSSSIQYWATPEMSLVTSYLSTVYYTGFQILPGLFPTLSRPIYIILYAFPGLFDLFVACSKEPSGRIDDMKFKKYI